MLATTMALLQRYFAGHFITDLKKIFGIFLVICTPIVGLFHFIAFDMYHKAFVLIRIPILMFVLGYLLTPFSIPVLIIIILLPVWIGWPVLMAGLVYMLAL
jgi:hypothetical protein